MKKVIFFLRYFSDIDHMAAVMWKLLQKGHHVTAVVMNPFYRISTDVRFKFLKKFSHFKLCYYYQLKRPIPTIEIADIFQNGIYKNIIELVFKVINRVFYRESWAEKVLGMLNPKVCIFDWGGIEGAIRGKFFRAGKKFNIPVFCLPHGLNTLMDYDLKKSLKGTRKVPDFVRRSKFDAYIFQSVFHKDKSIKWGLNPDICYVLGSARFCPEWQRLYASLIPDFKTVHNFADKIKVVFMLPQWKYNVNKNKTLELIDKLANDKWIYLVIKEHTRKSGHLPASYKARFNRSDNIEFAVGASSVALIRWADAVINMGSSIGLEVLLQDKCLLSPAYLHDNTTVFEETKACQIADNPDQVMDIIRNFNKNRPSAPHNKESVKKLMDMVVYGSKGPHDVLESYSNFILNKS